MSWSNQNNICFLQKYVCNIVHIVFEIISYVLHFTWFSYKTYIDSDAECVRFTASHANFSFLMISASQIWDSLSFNWMSKQHFLQFITVLVTLLHVVLQILSFLMNGRRRTHCHLVQRQVDDGNFFERLWIDDLCLVWKGLTLLTNMGNDKGMARWSRRCPLANAYYSLSTKNKRIKTDEMQTFDMFMFLFRLIWGQGSKYIKIVSSLWIFWKDETCLRDAVCLQRVWQISWYVRLRCQDCWRNSTWQTNLREEKLMREYI